MYQNQLKQVMNVRLPNYGTNKCEPTDLFLTINQPAKSVTIKKKGTCMLIDVTIPGDRNMIKKVAEKILKYKDFIIEIQGM